MLDYSSGIRVIPFCDNTQFCLLWKRKNFEIVAYGRKMKNTWVYLASFDYLRKCSSAIYLSCLFPSSNFSGLTDATVQHHRLNA